MSLRAFKSILKSKTNSVVELNLDKLSETKTDHSDTTDIEQLKDRIDQAEKALNLSLHHASINLEANIDDMRMLIDRKRPEQQIYKSSICDLWLELKSLEHMEPVSLVASLRKNQLHRAEMKLFETSEDLLGPDQRSFLSPRRSRLIHLHLCKDSDQFQSDAEPYVGLLVFSYDHQSKFILNRQHCQRGDILIKQTKSLGQGQTVKRGVYDALFKSYFNRSIDEKFFGVGFLCVNGRCRLDLISFDERELYLYEYRLFDVFMLTHWLTQTPMEPNAQEMERNAKDLLVNQLNIVKGKLGNPENTALQNTWTELVGSDVSSLLLAIAQFHETIEQEVEMIFKETKARTNIRQLTS